MVLEQDDWKTRSMNGFYIEIPGCTSFVHPWKKDADGNPVAVSFDKPETLVMLSGHIINDGQGVVCRLRKNEAKDGDEPVWSVPMIKNGGCRLQVVTNNKDTQFYACRGALNLCCVDMYSAQQVRPEDVRLTTVADNAEAAAKGRLTRLAIQNLSLAEARLWANAKKGQAVSVFGKLRTKTVAGGKAVQFVQVIDFTMEAVVHK